MNLHKKHDRFLTNGHSLGGERTDVVYSSRYDRNVAFANFNEPEWLAAADSTFLHFSLCGVQRSRRVGKFLAIDVFCKLTDC